MREKEPLVSILIPAYDAEKWIAESIQSALIQTWPNKEIIIVDDGSRDRTLEVAKKFESSIVKIISQENRIEASLRPKTGL
ncbi:MAG: glycosyltransferase family A protein [Candidatus Omnitrophica bacterium]|nr:glycosyltransferase family A protein [Candidatus Omnitrophota bacterium]